MRPQNCSFIKIYDLLNMPTRLALQFAWFGMYFTPQLGTNMQIILSLCNPKVPRDAYQTVNTSNIGQVETPSMQPVGIPFIVHHIRSHIWVHRVCLVSSCDQGQSNYYRLPKEIIFIFISQSVSQNTKKTFKYEKNVLLKKKKNFNIQPFTLCAINQDPIVLQTRI